MRRILGLVGAIWVSVFWIDVGKKADELMVISRGLASNAQFLEQPYSQSPFAVYADEFEHRAKEAGVVTRLYAIRFGNPGLGENNLPALGFCEPNLSLERAVVTIGRQFWNVMSDSCKRALIFHELGHCALGKGHAPGIMRSVLNCDAVADEAEIEKLWH